jgi:general stress protein 26
VSLYGTAEIIDDEKLKEKYWKKTWQSFYPDYPEGYCLIRFTPRYLELISEKHGVTGDPLTWKPAAINF